MPSYRWTCLIAALCGVGGATWPTTSSAFQFPPLSDDINTRQIHRPEAWIGGGFQSNSEFNQSPAEFGPAQGMWQRSANGDPASGDSFPTMIPGPLPGGLSPDGFNGSGMWPPVNQPNSMANEPQFGANGQSQFGQNPAGQGPFGNMPFGSPAQMTGANRKKPKMSWALESAQQPYVGLLGQVVRPGVYEIERQRTSLSDLLQNIGGLAKDASGQFRIIRNGRPGLMTPYSGAAQFELMAGDLIIADAQISRLGQRETNAKQASAGAVQIGFVNLTDRPVVLKLNNEHATASEILSIMRQDPNLASQIKFVLPSSQRGQGQPRPDATLVSETVLIFPPNSVKSDRLPKLPDPYRLKHDSDTPAQPSDAVQPHSPRGNLSPDVTRSPESKPAVEAVTESVPLPQTAQSVSRPSVEPAPEVIEVPPPPTDQNAAFDRASGVRGVPRRTTTAPPRIARDSDMVLAPPAEGSTPSPRDVPPTDAVQDNAPAPEWTQAMPFDDDAPTAEPSRLNAKGQHRPIHLAQDSESNDVKQISENPGEPNTVDQAGSSWSIWPPILVAGTGLLALIGFSFSLRRRTQTTAMSSSVGTTLPPPTVPAPTSVAMRNPPMVHHRELLDEIIDNELPLTEEQVPLASPMHFHGRPQPPKTIRMDQRHSLPRPHSPTTGVGGQRSGVRGQESGVRGQSQETSRSETASASRTTTTATQKFRIDRTGVVETGAQPVSAPMPKTSSHQTSTGPLDRALSAVQKQSVQIREERGA